MNFLMNGSYKNFIYVIIALSLILLSKINDLAQRVHVSEILRNFCITIIKMLHMKFH